jgi:hypothetical protein
VLQGWPGWPRGSQRPDGQVEVRQLVDDFRRAPARELQAGVSEHLLGCAGPPGITLAGGGLDVIGRRQHQQGREVREPARTVLLTEVPRTRSEAL